MGLYALLWYGLAALRKMGLSARHLIAAVVISGAFAVMVGFLQAANGAPRPAGFFGGPNTFGGFLAALCCVLFGAVLTADHHRKRVGALAGLFAAGAMLILTTSRGAWVGAAVGLAGTLTLAGWAQSWQIDWRSRRVRVIVALIVIAGAAALPLAYAVMDSLSGSTGHASPELRFGVYAGAVQVFLEHPLAGTGVFTFGAELMRFQSSPPLQPNAHAHNIILNAAAEMGLPGLLALAVLGGGLVRMVARSVKQNSALAGAAGALVAMAAHGMFDIPMMSPSVVIAGLMLAAALLPPKSERAPERRATWRAAALLIGWAALLISGWWALSVYRTYIDGLKRASEGKYAAGADLIGRAALADPLMPVYHWQHGQALAAAGDVEGAMAAYERGLAIEDGFGPNLINAAALYAQNGQLEDAIGAALTATVRAPEDPVAWKNLGRYLEEAGRDGEAAVAYEQAAVLIPKWCAINDVPGASTFGANALGRVRARFLQVGWGHFHRETFAELYLNDVQIPGCE
jgi:O-antigen ligase